VTRSRRASWAALFQERTPLVVSKREEGVEPGGSGEASAQVGSRA
jgi:hypothetical protein